MKKWKWRLSIQDLKMASKSLFTVITCTLVLLGIMFGIGNYNTGSVAYAAEPSPAGPSSVEGDRWSLSGWLNIVWGDGRDGETQTIYMLTDDRGAITPLLLDEALSQSVGGVLWFNRKRVNVGGVWASFLTAAGAETGLNVTSISLAQPPETGALADDIPQAVSGAQPWVTIMCKFSDVATEPRDLAYFTDMYSNVYPRLDHYWRELSYNTFNISGSNAFGWFTLPQPESYYNPTDTTGGTNLNFLANDCIASADASVNFAPYVGINMMFNTDFDNGYAWGGSSFRTIDGVSKSWRITWEPPWAYNSISVIQHEMGHGFGLPHSSGAYGQTYDNAWDVMSRDRYNCAAATDPTYGCIGQGTISYHKDILESIPAGQKYTVALGTSATITLEQLALPQTSNYKMAKIPIGGSSTHFYTVEARRQTGYDSKLAGNAIIIHEVDTTRSRPAWVIDTDLNGNTADAGAMWVVGETFTDAANNISVNVDSATATGFQVTISNASSLCSGAIPLTSGVPYNGTTVGGPSSVSAYSCIGWNESGPERFHVITTTVAGNITATLTNLSGVDLDVFILSACNPSSCVAYGDTSATYPNGPPGTYYIVVDGYLGASGSYTLTVNISTPDIRQPIASISFGNVNVGGSLDQTTTLYNDGTGTLTINSIARSSGSTEFTYVGPATPFNISGGGSQTITVRFSPTSGGAKSATFNVSSNDPDEGTVSFSVSANQRRGIADFDGDGSSDLAGRTSNGLIFYTTDLSTWNQIPGVLDQLVVGDYDGDGLSDLAGLTGTGLIFYTTNLSTWTQIPGVLDQLFVGDFDGNGLADLAGLTSSGQIFYTTDLQSWATIPGLFSLLVVGDFNSDGNDDLAGLGYDGSIWYTIDFSAWTKIPGTLSQLVSGDFNPARAGDELAGLASNGTIWVTTDLLTWVNIPGLLNELVVGDFNGDGNDDLAGLSSNGSIWLTTDLSAWTHIPGVLSQLVVGDFDGDSQSDLAGLTSNGLIFYTTNLSIWTQIPGVLLELAE